jgi:hypothetical protein
MTRVELETEIVQKIHVLPFETLEKIVIFIKAQTDKKQVKQRTCGTFRRKSKLCDS